MDGAADVRLVEVRISRQSLEKLLGDAGLSPAAKASERAVQFPNISAGPARTLRCAPSELRLQEQPIARAGAPGMTTIPGQQRRNKLRLLVFEHPSIPS